MLHMPRPVFALVQSYTAMPVKNMELRHGPSNKQKKRHVLMDLSLANLYIIRGTTTIFNHVALRVSIT